MLSRIDLGNWLSTGSCHEIKVQQHDLAQHLPWPIIAFVGMHIIAVFDFRNNVTGCDAMNFPVILVLSHEYSFW